MKNNGQIGSTYLGHISCPTFIGGSDSPEFMGHGAAAGHSEMPGYYGHIPTEI